ncbi:hypothetical protein JT313_gp15 [Ruegeria phage vB_RpoS-V11]|uniref:hypothetical protein n=1 Tax=Ruegeria phage vB_RpoS-V11 TaxID=2218617 RepID=UPI000DCAC4BD|nr:hypothetical protein JT313_gp15 [Ruegeria phage vB_RpoS-V11]AWY09055.1 hypothetical protein vBRpoSV11_15 [Ruegeria phage vB_RpoS-V11]
MIDVELMKDINRQMLDADVEMARKARQSGITVMPNPNVQRGKPLLLVHPEAYEVLRKEPRP